MERLELGLGFPKYDVILPAEFCLEKNVIKMKHDMDQAVNLVKHNNFLG